MKTRSMDDIEKDIRAADRIVWAAVIAVNAFDDLRDESTGLLPSGVESAAYEMRVLHQASVKRCDALRNERAELVRGG